MNKELTIGLFGAPVNSTNLGCIALTYSLLKLLQEIEKENSLNFKYIIFEGMASESKLKYCCEILDLPPEKYKTEQIYSIQVKHSYIKHFKHNRHMIKAIESCDVIIDVTAGDSFTDIYGQKRFFSTTYIKQFVAKKKIPLVLAPQTYGPFNSEKNKKKAAGVIRRADLVFARDRLSYDFVKNISGREAIVTTDLAFQLPFERRKKENNSKIKVGLNISGLLVANPTETSTERAFSLKTDYDKYICNIIEYLSSKEGFDIYLIPHVKEDSVAIKKFNEMYPNTHIVDVFDNPVGVKSFISCMDLFIGGRMHATIGAYSSNVVTIPTSYSRKFAGVFGLVDYNYTVDLCELNTEEATSKTVEYIEKREQLAEALSNSLIVMQGYLNITKDKLSEFLKSL